MSESAAKPSALQAPPDLGGNALLNVVEWIVAPERLLNRGLRRCGPTFTVSLFGLGKLLLVGEPLLLKQIDRIPDCILSARDGNDLMVRLLGEKSLFLQDGVEHDARRTLIRDALHGVPLTVLRKHHVHRTIQALDKVADFGRVSFLHPVLKRLSLETVCELAFGKEWQEVDRLEDALHKVTGLLSTIFAYVPPLRKKVGPFDLARIADRRVDKVDRIMYETILRSRQSPETSGALGAIISIAADRGILIDDQELRDQALSIVLAGYETTACTIGWAIEHCFSDPATVAALGNTGDIGVLRGDLISAAFLESQRLNPTIESFARGARMEIDLGCYRIAKGTLVAPCAYLAQRVAYPDNPDQFDPARMLAARPRYGEFLPFGLSSRYCLGARVASMQAEEVLRLLASRYTIRLSRSRPSSAFRSNVVLAPRGRTRARLKRAVGYQVDLLNRERYYADY